MHVLLLLAALSAPDSLPRRALLGVALGPPVRHGTSVQRVLPNTTAATLGLEAGDVIVAVNGRETPRPPAVLAALQRVAAGDPLIVRFRRQDTERTVTGTAVGRPSEVWPDAEVRYEQLSVGDSVVRSIMVRPKSVARPPVVFLIQGYTCGSIEWPNSPIAYRQLFEPIVQSGYALFRVEKLGVGDSRGPVACRDADWATEVDAFAAAYRSIFERDDIDPDRVFIFGHSMGGIVAPLLAAGVKAPRGLAVYGTVLRPWDEYLIDIVRVQPTIATHADPAVQASLARAHYDELRRYLLQDHDPERMIRGSAAAAARWKKAWDYDGGPRLLGRAHGFWRGLAKADITRAWHRSGTPVLVMHGMSDVEAIDDEDATMIVRIVNHAAPGSARLALFPGTSHGFALVGDEADHRRHRNAGTLKELAHNFNPEVRRTMLDWMQTHRAEVVKR